jgi:DNA-directed RNA polymerase subunit L
MLAVQINDCWKTITETDISHPQKSIVEINLGKIDHTVAQCLVSAWNKMEEFKEKYTMPSYRLIHPLKETMILSLRIVNTSVAPQVKEIMSMLHTCFAICVDDIGYLLDEYDTVIPSTRSHTKIADSPDDWILSQTTIPLVSQSLLPNRSPRTKWNISAALLRSGS